MKRPSSSVETGSRFSTTILAPETGSPDGLGAESDARIGNPQADAVRTIGDLDPGVPCITVLSMSPEGILHDPVETQAGLRGRIPGHAVVDELDRNALPLGGVRQRPRAASIRPTCPSVAG